jgi:hypothetical protein
MLPFYLAINYQVAEEVVVALEGLRFHRLYQPLLKRL